MSHFSKPYNPVGSSIDAPVEKRGFFSSLLSNKYSDAMNAYIGEQQKAGVKPASVDWGSLDKEELKKAYQRKYKRPFPD